MPTARLLGRLLGLVALARPAPRRPRPKWRPTLEPLCDRVLPIVGAGRLADFALPGEGFDGVVKITREAGGGRTVRGTGTLLSTGHHVLTAAHVVDNDAGKDVGDGKVDKVDIRVTFEMLGVPPVVLTVPSAKTQDLVKLYKPGAGGWNGDFSGGYDIAVITLPELAPLQAQRAKLYEKDDEVGVFGGQPITLVGYGNTGVGTAGGEEPGTYGRKHRADNRVGGRDNWDFPPLAARGLTYEFPVGAAAGLGLSAQGDSGGPAFIGGRLAGVMWGIYNRDGSRAPGGEATSTLGDLGGLTRVSYFAGWIKEQLAQPYDLVLDLNHQPWGLNGKADTPAVRVRRAGAKPDTGNVQLRARNPARPEKEQVVDCGPVGAVRSVKVVGGPDPFSVSFENDLTRPGGMPLTVVGGPAADAVVYALSRPPTKLTFAGAEGDDTFLVGKATSPTDRLILSGVGRVQVTGGGTLDVTKDLKVPKLDLLWGTVAGAGTLTATDTLTWGDDLHAATMTGAGETVIPAGGALRLVGKTTKYLGRRTLSVAPGAKATHTGNGKLLLADRATLDNGGTFTADGPGVIGVASNVDRTPLTFRNRAGATFAKTGAGDFAVTEGSNTYLDVQNAGTVRVVQGSLTLWGRSSYTGKYAVAAGAELTLAAGGGRAYGLAKGAAVTGAGTLTVWSGVATVAGDVGLSAGGKVRFLGGTTTVTGTVAAPAGIMVVFGATLMGTGTLTGPVTNAGVVDPGAGPKAVGTLTVKGSYTQTAVGWLVIDLSAPGPGGSDHLVVKGKATLAGVFLPAQAPDFFPEIGDAFAGVLTYHSYDGKFGASLAPVHTRVGDPKRAFAMTYADDGLTLTVVKK